MRAPEGAGVHVIVTGEERDHAVTTGTCNSYTWIKRRARGAPGLETHLIESRLEVSKRSIVQTK